MKFEVTNREEIESHLGREINKVDEALIHLSMIKRQGVVNPELFNSESLRDDLHTFLQSQRCL